VSAIIMAIEGPTGVGKTTLSARLATVLDAEAVLGPFEANPFLAPLLTSSQPT
jgi:deoxyadenosine/deoxycytidine kinase